MLRPTIKGTKLVYDETSESQVYKSAPINMEDFPRVYYDNPTHCQWYKTEIYHITKIWAKASSEIWLQQFATGGQEIKETKAEVIPGQGAQNKQILQNQIVPGGGVGLSWQFYDGDTVWEHWAFDYTYFNTKYLTGGKIIYRNPNRYGSGELEKWIPFYNLSCNGQRVAAYGAGWIDWEVDDWTFAIIRPLDNDPERWDTDDRIDINDLEKAREVSNSEDHLLLIPLRIGQHGD
jgi:hypothetical protein